MYNRDMGGIRSDGQLSQLREQLKKSYEDEGVTIEHKPEKRLIDLGFLQKLQIDDLILIGIGILLLLDSDGSSDMILILIAAMLFF